MMRPAVIAISMSMLAACGGLAYVHVTRHQPDQHVSGTNDSTATLPSAANQSSQGAALEQDVVAPNEAEPPGTPNSAIVRSAIASNVPRGINATPDTIAQWIEDTQSPDAGTRAAAIAALANAPQDLAMPALVRVLEGGEPNVDRHIALRSMHAIALRNGDGTGQIRDAMRHAIYHGDDDEVTQTAQSLLDDIEAEFALREQAPNE